MEIPVKKTSGLPWWLWLIAALLLVGLLWWFLAGREDDADAPGLEPVGAVAVPATGVAGAEPIGAEPLGDEPGAAAQGPITDLAVIVDAENRQALIGREFQLSNVRVLDVVGDRSFWVGPSADRRVFAALREVPPPGSPSDKDININAQQIVSMRGVIRSAADGELAGRTLEGVPARTDIVLFAQTAEVVSRP